MRSTAVIRQEIESSLAARIPVALSVRFQHSPDLVPTGIGKRSAPWGRAINSQCL